jgi:hypothetical protein
MRIRAPRSRIKVSLLTCRFSLLPPANCQPGGRTRAATRMAGLSGAHVSEGNAESCNPILTRLHIAERTEQPPVRNGASLRYPEMGESDHHSDRVCTYGKNAALYRTPTVGSLTPVCVFMFLILSHAPQLLRMVALPASSTPPVAVVRQPTPSTQRRVQVHARSYAAHHGLADAALR